MDVIFYIAAMCLGWACAGVVGSFLTTGRWLDLFAGLAAAFLTGVALSLGCMTTILQARARIGKRGGS